MCVGFLYTVDVSIPSLSLFNKQSKKGSLLSSSDSIVNFIEGLTEFKWSNKCFSLLNYAKGVIYILSLP